LLHFYCGGFTFILTAQSIADLRNIVPDSMDSLSACDLSTQPQKKLKNSESNGGQVKMLMKAIDTEIKLVRNEFSDDSEVVFTEKVATQFPQQADRQCCVRAPNLISNQDDIVESTIVNEEPSTAESKEFFKAGKSYAGKVDDHSVSVLLSKSDDGGQERSMDSFLKVRVDHDQHRLEIQQRAKNLLRIADDKLPRRWQGSSVMDEEGDEETSLLNSGQSDKPWSGCEECGDILADSIDIGIPAEQTRTSREVDESSRPRSPALTNDDTVEQTGGLAALKETVAAKLSIFRRDLLPLKLPMGNAGDDSPGRGVISHPAKLGQREDIESVSTNSEVSDRAAAHAEVGGKTGFALLRNSLAILREDLGLGLRP
jgi:hypothetical protein